jgi:hydrogenase maturation protease
VHFLFDAFSAAPRGTELDMEYRFIGCGNADRGDDAAGILVVRHLRNAGFKAYEHRGDGLALIESWSGSRAVILIDAVVTGGLHGAMSWWDARHAPVNVDCFRSSTHAFNIADAVALARLLQRIPPRLVIYGIEGRCFDLGAAPSHEVVAGSERLAQHLIHTCAEACRALSHDKDGV